jgi:Helix-turn-helix domain
MGEEKRAFKGVWICAAIFLDERITPSEKMLLAEIDSLTTEDHGCYASNAHFAKRLGVTESRANHVLSRLTREGYIVRVCYDGRISHRVVAPEYSSNPATSRRLIERNRRLAKNDSSELSRLEDSNSEMLKIAALACQKGLSRTATNKDALLLKKIPTENTNRKTTTTYPDVDNEESDVMKSAETSSSRRCSQPTFQLGFHDSPAAALGDRLAVELAEEFGLSSKQRQRVTEFFESHGQGYVRSKAEIVRSAPRKNAAELDLMTRGHGPALGSTIVDVALAVFALYLDYVQVDKRIFGSAGRAATAHPLLLNLQTKMLRTIGSNYQ